jgi:hypothetical protein
MTIEGGLMKKRIWTVVAGVASVAMLIAVPAAYAAYTSPKLEIFQTATGVTVRASLDPNDDATARVAINVPVGTQLTTTQAPGTALGAVEALVKALDLGGADLPLQGQLVVAAPGQVPAATQTACIGSTTPLATWVMVLTAAGQTLTVPTYLLPQPNAQLGPAFIVICLPPPDVPAGTSGRSTFGAKVYSAALTITGVFSPVTSGVWLASWVPYNPGIGTANVSGAVASPAAIAPGAVNLSARRSGRNGVGATLTGRVTQGGRGRSATVTVFGGSRASRLRSLGRARVAASGAFTFRARAGTFFRARAVGVAGAAPQVCTRLQPLVGAVPCVNPTINGFTAQSRVVRKR